MADDLASLESANALSEEPGGGMADSDYEEYPESVPAVGSEEATTSKGYLDPGPPRPEDNEVREPTQYPEVDLESQRKDETSSLAHDRYDSKGNRIN